MGVTDELLQHVKSKLKATLEYPHSLYITDGLEYLVEEYVRLTVEREIGKEGYFTYNYNELYMRSGLTHTEQARTFVYLRGCGLLEFLPYKEFALLRINFDAFAEFLEG